MDPPVPAVRFQGLDREAHLYPRSRIPMTPVWPFLRLAGPRGATPQSRFSGADCARVAGGRYGIALALRAAGLTDGDRVLLPAYHCGSMVEPALWVGARVSFYHLGADLSPDLDDLGRRLKGGGRAVLMTHYFGFPQAVGAVRQLCDEHRAVLIEDCAHALFDLSAGAPPGSTGHFAVASTRKFCPGPDGGVVCSNIGAVPWPGLKAPGVRSQLRALYRVAEGMLGHVLSSGGSASNPATEVSPAVGDLPLQAAGPEARTSAGAPRAWRWFSPPEAELGMTWAAKTMFRLADGARIAAARRRNYEFLLERCSGLGRAEPLYRRLPDAVVPYAFPLRLRHPAEDFRRLKYRGVPIWRWDELAVSDCPVSQEYRLSLLQLPCHENLRPRDGEWMTEVLREVLA